jgi:hypothetical protein
MFGDRTASLGTDVRLSPRSGWERPKALIDLGGRNASTRKQQTVVSMGARHWRPVAVKFASSVSVTESRTNE